MSWLTWAQGFYLLASIFGVGVTAIDLLGILGSDDSDSDVGDLDVGGDVDAGDMDAGDLDLDHGGVTVEAGEVQGDDLHGDTHQGDLVQSDGKGDLQANSVAGTSSVFTSTLLFVSFLRRTVYFSLGFGPVGLAAIATGSSAVGSLLWALPTGVVSMLLAGWIFRFQRKDVDSSVTGRELFFQRARVLVPIVDGGMGKVRVSLGQSVAERYARANDKSQSFSKGTEVYITRVTADCVFVEAISEEIATK